MELIITLMNMVIGSLYHDEAGYDAYYVLMGEKATRTKVHYDTFRRMMQDQAFDILAYGTDEDIFNYRKAIKYL